MKRGKKRPSEKRIPFRVITTAITDDARQWRRGKGLVRIDVKNPAQWPSLVRDKKKERQKRNTTVEERTAVRKRQRFPVVSITAKNNGFTTAHVFPLRECFLFVVRCRPLIIFENSKRFFKVSFYSHSTSIPFSTDTFQT